MKKRIAALLLAVICLALTAVSCKKDTKQDGLLGLVATYVGEPVKDTRHEFSKDDFQVIAAYEDGSNKTLTDYDFKIDRLQDGYYLLSFTYGDKTNYCFVPCEVSVYPSDSAQSDSAAD